MQTLRNTCSTRSRPNSNCRGKCKDAVRGAHQLRARDAAPLNTDAATNVGAPGTGDLFMQCPGARPGSDKPLRELFLSHKSEPAVDLTASWT